MLDGMRGWGGMRVAGGDDELVDVVTPLLHG
jgi:hypothetical protein